MSQNPRASSTGSGAPSTLALIASVIVTLLQVANQIVLTDAPQVRIGLAAVLAYFATVGISGLTSADLVTVYHLSKQALVLLGAAISTAAAAVSIIPMSTSLHTVLATVISGIGALILGTPGLVAQIRAPRAVHKG